MSRWDTIKNIVYNGAMVVGFQWQPETFVTKFLYEKIIFLSIKKHGGLKT